MGLQLLPDGVFAVQPAGSEAETPTRTYAVDFERGRVRGHTDGREAMEQAVFKALQTWLNAHDVYDGRYGFEARGLVGRDFGYVRSELKRRIKEALLADGRIYEVGSFAFEAGEAADALTASFVVKTRFGRFEERTEVKLA